MKSISLRLDDQNWGTKDSLVRGFKKNRLRKVTLLYCNPSALSSPNCFLENSANIAPLDARSKTRFHQYVLSPCKCAIGLRVWITTAITALFSTKNPCQRYVWYDTHLFLYLYCLETSFVEFSRDVYRELLAKSKPSHGSSLTFL